MDSIPAFAKTKHVAVTVMARNKAIQCTRKDSIPALAKAKDVTAIVMARNEAKQSGETDGNRHSTVYDRFGA
jgi:hypothetical protein